MSVGWSYLPRRPAYAGQKVTHGLVSRTFAVMNEHTSKRYIDT